MKFWNNKIDVPLIYAKEPCLIIFLPILMWARRKPCKFLDCLTFIILKQLYSTVYKKPQGKNPSNYQV